MVNCSTCACALFQSYNDHAVVNDIILSMFCDPHKQHITKALWQTSHFRIPLVAGTRTVSKISILDGDQ